MSRIAVVSFSLTGGGLAERIQRILMGDTQVELYALKKYARINGQIPVEPSLSQWCGGLWNQVDVLIFVGASGIAVRTIAPYVKSKVSDPAVLVIDEGGNFVISLLSGHLGGANDWTRKLARDLAAIPVITTATDVEHLFAVDSWAKGNHLSISSMKLAKEVSADLLHGKKVFFGSEIPWEGQIPKELTVYDFQQNEEETAEKVIACDFQQNEEKTAEKVIACDFQQNEEETAENVTICESWKDEEKTAEAEVPVLIWCGLQLPDRPYPGNRILWLAPTCLALGVGCRRGKEYEVIARRLREVLDEAGLSSKSIQSIASIDLKKEEEGIIRLADWLQVPFHTYSSEELSAVEGDFTTSSFVSQITGVDNVCERSAIRESGGHLIVRKQAREGVTIALAAGDWRIRF